MPKALRSLTAALRRSEYLPIVKEVLLPLIKLCPECYGPVENGKHPALDRCKCRKCRRGFCTSDVLVAIDEKALEEAFATSNRFLDRLFVLKRNYPLARNGKLIKGMKGRIKAQKGRVMQPADILDSKTRS